MHEGGPKDLAWIAPDGHELSAEAWNDDRARTLGMYVSGELHAVHPDGTHVKDDSFLVLLHAGESEQAFVLPDGPYARSYRRVIDSMTGSTTESTSDEAAGSVVTLAPHSLVVLRVFS
jgi:glycogen operon protein